MSDHREGHGLTDSVKPSGTRVGLREIGRDFFHHAVYAGVGATMHLLSHESARRRPSRQLARLAIDHPGPQLQRLKPVG